jgi:quercetin dioxygenase-like cupin family protein
MERRRRGMARAGEVLENHISGQRIIFRKTASDTDGELLEVEAVYTKPSPSRPPAHYHPYQEERFEVLSGRIKVMIEGEERAYGEGEDFVVLPGTPHEMWAEEAGARVSWQTRPAMKTDEFFEAIWGLAKAGKINEKGVPNLLQVAVIAREHADEYRLVKPPWRVQRALFAVLAPAGRLLGYRARYPEYGG